MMTNTKTQKRDSVVDYLQRQHHMVFPCEVEIGDHTEDSIREVLNPLKPVKADALRTSVDTSMFKGTRYSSVQ